MNEKIVESKIESSFRRQVQKDKKVKAAFLFVNSDKLNINIKVAEGNTGNIKAHINQPVHLASVGKLFTATIISILFEKGKLDFDDCVRNYLDADLMNGLHVYKGNDYSDQITIRHLLMQTSGLNDVFYHLWKKMTKDPMFKTTPREALIWGKKNLKPVAVPEKRHFYTDTNYYLLGLIIENISGKKFHEVMHELIFEPLGMKYAYMHGVSKPKIESGYPLAPLFIKGVDVNSINGVHQIDYAGGSVIAALDDHLLFMKSLLNSKIIKRETLNRMIEDDVNMGFPTVGFKYGYSVWKMKTIPLIMPEKFNCWGCVGVTGAFMFYHPLTESYIIGTFNDFSYRGKALEFMARKVIKELLSYQINTTD
ncbi:MAG: serine hydrolase [Ignavibacterium sp.]|nr:serine hydrolase [Ignavibacterium sp.]